MVEIFGKKTVEEGDIFAPKGDKSTPQKVTRERHVFVRRDVLEAILAGKVRFSEVEAVTNITNREG